jgi:hypothetical protein
MAPIAASRIRLKMNSGGTMITCRTRHDPGVGKVAEGIGGSSVADEARQGGVSRGEFYGIVALLSLSPFTVINLLAFAPNAGLRAIPSVLPFVAILGAGVWFTSLPARERKPRKAANEGEAQQSPE